MKGIEVSCVATQRERERYFPRSAEHRAWNRGKLKMEGICEVFRVQPFARSFAATGQSPEPNPCEGREMLGVSLLHSRLSGSRALGGPSASSGAAPVGHRQPWLATGSRPELRALPICRSLCSRSQLLRPRNRRFRMRQYDCSRPRRCCRLDSCASPCQTRCRTYSGAVRDAWSKLERHAVSYFLALCIVCTTPFARKAPFRALQACSLTLSWSALGNGAGAVDFTLPPHVLLLCLAVLLRAH